MKHADEPKDDRPMVGVTHDTIREVTDLDRTVLEYMRGKEPLRSVEIAQALGMKPRRVSYCLGVLRMRNLVTLTHVYGSNFWSAR